jgi:hypothetical protein
VKPVGALREAIGCCWLGLKEALSPSLVLFSMGLWGGAAALWSMLAWMLPGPFLWLGREAAGWAMLGVFQLWDGGLSEASRQALETHSMAEAGQIILGGWHTAGAWVCCGLMILLAIFLTARVGLEFLLLPRVRERVRPQYPSLLERVEAPLSLAPVGRALKFASLTVLVLPLLLVPGLNLIVGVGFFGYLNIRTLVHDALETVAEPEEQRAVVQAARWQMVWAGLMLVGGAAMPVLSLLAPAWIAGTTCHLCCRVLERVRITPG